MRLTDLHPEMERIEIAMDAVRGEFSNLIMEIKLVGSTYISGRTDSDVDILILVESQPDPMTVPALWEVGGSEPDGGGRSVELVQTGGRRGHS